MLRIIGKRNLVPFLGGQVIRSVEFKDSNVKEEVQYVLFIE